MREFNDLLKKYELKPHRYTRIGKVTVIDTDEGKYVVKRKKENNQIYNYLKNRNFDYYPKLINKDNDIYDIREYISDDDVPNEQKIIDLVNLTALLHSKTTHYKEIDFDDYKEIYEDINNNIEYLYSYYNDLITLIESKVYMSPSEYLLATNISKIFGSLNYSKSELEKWYKMIKDNTKQRSVLLHNNLDLSHFRTKEGKNYLLNFDKARVGIPIFDIYILYKRHALDYDFSELLKQYENSYPLKDYERKLLFILLAIPDKIELSGSTFEQTKTISRFLDLSYKTERLISTYYSKDSVKNS